MINYKFQWKGIPVYVDPYMKENEILKGRKENKGCFYVMSDKTANIIQQEDRCKKLERILSESN